MIVLLLLLYCQLDNLEIIDGERKSEIMGLETTTEKNRKLKNKMVGMMVCSAILVTFSTIMFTTNAFNGFISDSAYHNMMNFTLALTLATLVLNIMYLLGVFERIAEKK